MVERLLSVLSQLEEENVQYCLLRDYDQLQQVARKQEIDLLIGRDQLARLRQLLSQLGFVAIPSWGYAPHHFFVAYDEATDSWLKLDVVTEICYGQPIRALRTDLADDCLRNRQRSSSIFIPSPECELVTLLLHCILDKGAIAPSRGRRLQALRRQITDERRLSALLMLYWLPTMNWSQLAELIEAGEWEALLEARKAVADRLASRDRIGTLGRQIRSRVLRKLNKWVHAARPRALTVAVLAPDGAGKSTIVAGVQNTFYFPVRSIYMGLYQKGAAGWARLPIPGVRFLSRLLLQWWRYLRARYHQVRGHLVLFDRYTYDALLPSSRNRSWFKRWRRWLLANACPTPDLVILLDAPGEILYARKREHNATLLEQQRQHYLHLQSRLHHMVVVDATLDAESVRRRVLSIIWSGYLSHQAEKSGSR